MSYQSEPAVLDDLHFALDVMEERAHLGLNDQNANSLRCILLRRISEAETAISRKPAAPASQWTSQNKRL
jgi:hypothetical protein